MARYPTSRSERLTSRVRSAFRKNKASFHNEVISDVQYTRENMPCGHNGIGLCGHRHFRQCLTSEPMGDFGQGALLPVRQLQPAFDLGSQNPILGRRYSLRTSNSLST